MMWWWEFNAGEFYNTCADVTITAAVPGGPGGGTPGDGTPVGDGGGSPVTPIGGRPQTPPQTCVGLLVGECQTELDLQVALISTD